MLIVTDGRYFFLKLSPEEVAKAQDNKETIRDYRIDHTFDVSRTSRTSMAGTRGHGVALPWLTGRKAPRR